MKDNLGCKNTRNEHYSQHIRRGVYVYKEYAKSGGASISDLRVYVYKLK